MKSADESGIVQERIDGIEQIVFEECGLLSQGGVEEPGLLGSGGDHNVLESLEEDENSQEKRAEARIFFEEIVRK